VDFTTSTSARPCHLYFFGFEQLSQHKQNVGVALNVIRIRNLSKPKLLEKIAVAFGAKQTPVDAGGFSGGLKEIKQLSQ
jgi:hypothetical protein